MKLYLSIVAVAIFLFLSLAETARAEGFMIISNSETLTNHGSLYTQQLKHFMSLRNQYVDKTRLTVIFQPFDSRLHINFVRDYLDVDPRYFRNVVNHRIRMNFELKWLAANNTAHVLELMKTIPDAISYVNISTDLPANVKRIGKNEYDNIEESDYDSCFDDD